MREGVRAILEGTPDFKVVGEADTGLGAMRAFAKLQPDLVLMGVALSGISGIEAAAAILRQSPGAHILILSMHEDENTVIAAFRAGVRAYILKRSSSLELLDALRTVSRGGMYVSPHVSDHLLTRIQSGNMEPKDWRSSLSALSQREHHVLRLLAEGNTSKDIAALLGLPTQTICGCRKSLMKKLGVANVAGLTRAAIEAGVIGLSNRDEKLSSLPLTHSAGFPHGVTH
jgi:DNA-binding NarL/FixJ family response regulator